MIAMMRFSLHLGSWSGLTFLLGIRSTGSRFEIPDDANEDTADGSEVKGVEAPKVSACKSLKFLQD
jgi:hypothetical protein